MFAGWDVFPDDCYTAALKARVLENADLDLVKPFLQKIRPMPAVFDPRYVPRLRGGTNIKLASTKMDLAQRLIEDIERFRNDKTVLAPGLKARLLGLRGWFSSNILGNRDGEVLDDPMSFKAKEASKLSALKQILQPELYPELYSAFHHMIRINYYPPRGDNKESWDNIDIVGWLNYPMQIKVNFLCRDSILAAPLVLDLALFIDLAKRAGLGGIQDWLSFYFKSPMSTAGASPQHDLFIQLASMRSMLRLLMNEESADEAGIC